MQTIPGAQPQCAAATLPRHRTTTSFPRDYSPHYAKAETSLRKARPRVRKAVQAHLLMNLPSPKSSLMPCRSFTTLPNRRASSFTSDSSQTPSSPTECWTRIFPVNTFPGANSARLTCVLAFLLKPSSDKPKQISTYLYSQYGSNFEPAYSLRHPDPLQNDSRNRYAAAIYDSYNPEILYAEVLLVPSWTSPNPTPEQLRQNGGIPPPPEPILPTELTIQLYNPDQQITIRQKKPGAFSTGSPTWEFEMPQQTFREPSLSALDRTQHDPAILENTPKIGFKWKKDSKLSKDLACFLSGKSLNPDGTKKKSKEPDITVAIFKGLKEVTLYEPNLQRVDIEDMKGFEVVLLLGAVVIRDVYFGNMRETFNITDGRQLNQPSSPPGFPRPASTAPGRRDPRVPPTDARTQWEIDAETAALQKQALLEEKERQQQEEADRRRIKHMLHEEDRERRKKQAQVDKETERLKRLYGHEDASARPVLPPRHSAPAQAYDAQAFASVPQFPYQASPTSHANPYSSTFANNPWSGSTQPQPPHFGYVNPGPSQPQQHLKPKHSFFGFRRDLDNDTATLQKKRSAIF